LLLAQKLCEEARLYSLKPQFRKLATYQSIVAMGRQVLPYIFREIHDFGMLWDTILQDITQENPVLPTHKGNVEAIKQDWQQWAKELFI
jgi:hypothetical protein